MAEMSGAVLLGVDWSSPPVVACMAAVALTVVAEPLFGRYDIKCLAKTIASTCFLWVAIAALNPSVDGDVGRPLQGHPFNSSDLLSAIRLNAEWSEWSSYGRAIFGALVLGWLGDVFLLGKGSVGAFLAGLVSFLLGHLLYIVAFVFFGTGIDWTWFFGVGAIMIPMTLAIYAYLRAYLKSDMFVPVLAYMFVFFFMVTSAGGLYGGRGVESKQFNIFVGSIMFWASDLAVARDTFIRKGIENPAVGLPLYYGAQLVLASNIL